MRTTTVEKLASLQKAPANVRNICILAHVDHGKTTLADALVASNGIISAKMAGKLRYLDSREDEQLRGITMKSSAISLHYQTGGEDYLINLIDSPGHVDFSSEVSTAVRLCDGAIVVVDVVEGVCPQTHAVLRQAWLEDIRPILVLNKIDRLILELRMEPLEAFIHLQQILEQVNVVTSELFTADVMSKQTTNSKNEDGSANQNWTVDADEQEHRNIYFSPDQGNVIFASAYDSWGFLIGQFADLYSQKLGVSATGLCKTLWGDYYLNTKTKRVVKGAQAKGKKPLFVQFVLENIWSVYDAVIVRRDKEMTEKIVKSLNLSVAPRDLRHNDTRVQLQAITSRWLPVSAAVLSVVVEKLPSPIEILGDKVEKLMCSQARRFDSLPPQTQALKSAFQECSADDSAPVIIFVSKMFPVDKSALPKNKQRMLTEDEIQQRRADALLRHAAMLADRAARLEANTPGGATAHINNDMYFAMEEPVESEPVADHVFVAFGRVYSGTVRRGQTLYVLGPKHDPAHALEQIVAGAEVGTTTRVEDLASDQHIMAVTVTDLYLFMGRELEALDAVPAGNVLGIGGLEDHILKSGTLTSTVACPAFTDLYFDVSPILRVAIEPKQAGGIKNLVRGLKLLNQADPCVQVLVQETGEHVIITAGEVHLRRCIDDLTDRYAKIELSVSKPVVPFRETIVPLPTVDMVNESIQEQPQTARSERSQRFDKDKQVVTEGVVKIYTPDKKCMVQIRAVSLPETVTNLLDENQFLIKTLNLYVESRISEKGKSKMHKISKLKQSAIEDVIEFKVKLKNAFTESGKQWQGMVDCIWAFGPRRVGPNLLVNNINGYERSSIWSCIETPTEGRESVCLREYDYSVISGFQLATLTGPLCEEPMRGVCFVVEKWEVAGDVDEPENKEKVNIDLEFHSVMKYVSLESDMSNMSIGRLNGSSECEIGNSMSTEITLKSHDSVNQSEINGESCDSVNQSENHESCDTVTPTSDLPIHFPQKIPSRQRSRNSNSLSEFPILLDSDSDDDSDKDSVSGRRQGQGHMSGQLMSIVKDGCRKAFQTQPVRLMAAMYKCNIQATTEVLGKLYAVIGKRHGRIVDDELREGSQMFSIDAVLPVAESFGFAEELRKKTSGLASPQLVFSHWEVIDIDPFWVPTTEEEILHYGQKADSENRARVYMNNVRERKGLKVDKKIVEHAEKQRTLTRNK